MTSPSEPLLEPVAWRYKYQRQILFSLSKPGPAAEEVTPLYAHPITPPLVTSSGEPSKDDA